MLKVLFVSTEVQPFVKTGGLADVAYALPKALRDRGVDVRVILPKYGDLSSDYTSKMIHLASCGVSVGWRNQYCGLEYFMYENLPVYFIDNEYYFKRSGCYGYFDDGERFAYFCRAVLESVRFMEDFIPDIIHCNDWHTGMIPVLLRDVYFDRPEFIKAHSVFTIHNLQYQGIFSPAVLEDLLGLNMGYYTDEKCKCHDGVSFLKGGVVYADRVTTVSETYAKEICGPFFGEGLDGLMQEKSWKLSGIVNGIDYSSYDPGTDGNIAVRYTAKTPEKKKENKMALQQELGLPVNPDIPVVGVVSRLVRQKGLDLITCVMEDILKMDLQFVLLGTGDADYQDFFEYYSSAYPGKVAAVIGFDNRLANLIYAGSDIFLMPSLFEPCGISQLIAMRYGALPIVRETGGLKDTVQPYNEFAGKGNGFSFKNYNAHEMLDVLRLAVSLYSEPVWQKLIKNAMKTNNDWAKQSANYEALYQEIVGG